MPKVKNAPIKNSKKTVSTKRFSLTKLQVAFIVLVLTVVGVIVVYKSQAATSAVHEFVWNSPGISHTTGGPVIINTTQGSVQVYQVEGGSNCATVNQCSNGRYMWYGPYSTIVGNGHTYQFCWNYFAPTSKSFTVEFDVSWYDGTQFIIQPFNKTIAPSGTLSGLFVPQPPICKTAILNGGNWPKLEIRAKPISGGDGSTNNAFKLWKTSWQIIN